MLKQLPQFADYKIVRTRDPKLLEKCEIVVDVGGVFDHEARRYDHHQRGFTETMKTLTGLDFQVGISLNYIKILGEMINGDGGSDRRETMQPYPFITHHTHHFRQS
jgi:hypothetical protein